VRKKAKQGEIPTLEKRSNKAGGVKGVKNAMQEGRTAGNCGEEGGNENFGGGGAILGKSMEERAQEWLSWNAVSISEGRGRLFFGEKRGGQW